MFNFQRLVDTINPLKYLKRFQYNRLQAQYYKEALDHNERVPEQITDLQNKKALRVIETVRNIENRDYKIDSSYKPLIIKIVPSKKLTLLHTVTRNQKTGKVNYVADTSGGWWDINADVIGEEYLYPYKSETPYAMYLVPLDIQVGERVVLNDLIEDYVGSYINRSPYRLKNVKQFGMERILPLTMIV